MAKMTVYVPDALKRRMDEAGEGMNWSSLACRAFEAELARIITQKGAKDMRDVVARLKASKLKGFDESTQRGMVAGRYWAEHKAEYAELERVRSLHENRDGPEGINSWPERPTSDYCTELAKFITGHRWEKQGDEDLLTASDRFWIGVVGPDTKIREVENPSFLKGFVMGALEVWEQVKDEL